MKFMYFCSFQTLPRHPTGWAGRPGGPDSARGPYVWHPCCRLYLGRLEKYITWKTKMLNTFRQGGRRPSALYWPAANGYHEFTIGVMHFLNAYVIRTRVEINLKWLVDEKITSNNIFYRPKRNLAFQTYSDIVWHKQLLPMILISL